MSKSHSAKASPAATTKEAPFSFRSSRRQFLAQTLATVGGGVLLPNIVTSTALGGSGRPSASNRIVMGIIGAGGRGTQVLNNMMEYPEVQFVAVAEFMGERRQRAKAAMDMRYGNADAKEYRHFQELLERPDIDAVLIATGDRWHTLASITAARAGKDIYCEKPISMCIAEGRSLVETVKRHGRIFQAGTQRRSVGNFMFAVRLARTGKLGKLTTLNCSISGLEMRYDCLPADPEPSKDVLDWDSWLGPVPWRPYNQAYTRSMTTWRDFADLGGGGISDWGSHSIDLAQFANDTDLSGPTEFERVGDTVEAAYPSGVKIVMRMNMGRGPGKGTCPIHFEGDAGWVYTDDSGNIEVSPESLRTERTVSKEAWSRPVGHVRNFLDCVKARRQPAANAEVAHRAASVCHIANLAVKLGRKLRWDPVKEMFTGDEQANRLLVRAYREPWRI